VAELESDHDTIADGANETRQEREKVRALRKEERIRARALRQEAGRARAMRTQERVSFGAAEASGRQREPRLGGARKTLEGALQEIAHAPFAHPDAAVERLMAFPSAQVLRIRHLVTRMGPWPQVGDCLAVLFASRSGSTYLARELECTYDIGRLREALNLHLRERQTPGEIVKPGRNAWFSFKAGAPGVICAELSGFFEAYLETTSFIVLLRRDIVAQAVSNVKSMQTGQWHSNQKPKCSPTYDGASIRRYVVSIAESVEALRSYTGLSGRPQQVLLYEDFANGDFRKAEEACDSLGVPRRAPYSHIRAVPVERIGDATNEAWGARFREEMDSSLRDRIERYLDRI
jgi:LPS sulfotransferase NodH